MLTTRRTPRAIFAALFSAFLATSLACGKTTGGATEVKDTFHHGCRTDDDCTLAFIGGTCGICTSTNAAIAKADEAAYQKAYNDARDNCPKQNIVGTCTASYGVSQCGPNKTCTYVGCTSLPQDEHHCAPAPAPPDAGR